MAGIRSYWKASAPLVAMFIFWLFVGGGAYLGLQKLWSFDASLADPAGSSWGMTRRTEVFKTLLTVMQVAVIGSAAAVLLELFKHHQSSVAHQIDRQRRAVQDSRQAYDEIKTVRRLLKAKQPEHQTLRTPTGDEKKWPPVRAEWVVEHRALLERMGERLIKSQLQLEFLKEQYPPGSRTANAFKEMERHINRVSKVLLHAGCRDLDDAEIQLLNSFLGDEFARFADPYHTVLAELSA